MLNLIGWICYHLANSQVGFIQLNSFFWRNMQHGITRRIVARESNYVFILVQPRRIKLTQNQNNGPKSAFIKLFASLFLVAVLNAF